MTIAELLAARQAAGAAYADAVQTLKATLIELAALERAMQNGHVACHIAHTPKFLGGEWHNLNVRFAHPEFVSSNLGNWVDAVRDRSGALLRKLPSA